MMSVAAFVFPKRRPWYTCGMDAKENALRIIRFDHPERVVGGPPTHWMGYHGCNHEGYEGESRRGHDCPVGTSWVDIWGTRWEKEHPGVMGFPRGNPLADIEALRTYAWPDPDDERLCGRIYTDAQRCPAAERFLAGSHRDTLWEKAYMLVGMENMMIYLHTEPAYAREILHRIMDFQLGIAKHYLAAGIEIAGLGDDLGTQIAPLLNPKTITEFFMPEYRRLFDLYRQHGVLINFHSCGHIDWAIPMFLELGVNILNPVQANANDLAKVRRLTQGRMALQGAMSSATIMAGPPETIEREVRERITQLGQHGGYFCAPDQGMPWPAEHIRAMEDAVSRHGCYPPDTSRTV